MEKYGKYELAFNEPEEAQYMGGPVVPRVREYIFSRDISSNLNVKYFRELEDLPPLIKEGGYEGKWLIFVSQKTKGKELRDEFLSLGKAAVYVDADYDNCPKPDKLQEEAFAEIKNIRKKGLFHCDILITTAVLDNGVSIDDPKLKNIVLFTDDEISFKQMLGRRRFRSAEEKLNIFIRRGNAHEFRRHAENYETIYWKLCNRQIITLEETYSELRNNYNQTENLLSFYHFSGILHCCQELTIESVRNRSLYCGRVAEGLEGDDAFFLKVQLSWMGIKFSQEWMADADVNFSQENIDFVSSYLANLYSAGGILGGREFEELRKNVMKVAEKIEPQFLSGKIGNINTLNRALGLREEWKIYELIAIGDRKTYYELHKDGRARNEICEGLSLEKLEVIVEEAQEDGIRAMFSELFGVPLPLPLDEDESLLKVFINDKLKVYPGLEDKILKSPGGGSSRKITVGKRPRFGSGKS